MCNSASSATKLFFMHKVYKLILLTNLVLISQMGSAQGNKLSGTMMGSASGVNNGVAKAFDGDPSTYYSSSSASMTWVGLDLGSPKIITQIGFQPPKGSSSKMLLGVFEGANQPDFMDAIPLHFIAFEPMAGEMNYVTVNVSRGVRYVRYVGPANCRSQVAELEFYGEEGVGEDTHFYQITNIPTVSIHVKNNEVPTSKTKELDANITITYEDGTLIQEYPITARVRGNFSASHENKPYRIKFNDGKSHHMLKGSAKDESPAKAKKWTLVNNFGDKTLIRNNIAFEISRRVGLAYTPYCRNVDVLLNGEYRGMYQLTDWLGTDPNRIDITEMEPSDNEGENLTGGYFIEMNGYAGSDPVNFTSSHGNPVTVHSPEDDQITNEQFNYIRNHFNQMENLVYSSNYTDPEEGYRKMLDLDSFLKYFLACEYAGNTDMIWQVFMWKERGDDHIYTGPVWDNDLALDNDGSVYPGNERQDWTYTVRCAGRWGNFVSRILSDASAMGRLQTIWAELRDKDAFNKESMENWVDSLRRQVSASARLNHIRWPYLLQKVHCNPAVWGTWDAEVDVVRNYVGGRVAWFDKKLSYDQLAMKDGVYQIGTPRDLVTFSKMVREGATDANAVLLADLDMTDYDGTYVPIGDANHIYTGNFDGQRHTIRNLRVEGSFYVGFFGVVGGNATISNLTMDATCEFSGSRYVGSIAGAVRGSQPLNLIACGNEGSVISSSTYAGGLVGGASSAIVNITNCYNVGLVEASSEAGALAGYVYKANVSHSYNAGNVAGVVDGREFVNSKNATLVNCYDTQSDQVTRISVEQVLSGELCWRLNEQSGTQLWRQNLDNERPVDAYPLPRNTHSIVYQAEGRYTNINPDLSGLRYYKFEITDVQGGNWVQFSEFGLLDSGYNEYENLTVYAGSESTVSHENWPNAADHDTGTKYCSALNGRAWFLMDAGSEIGIYGYRIYTANDTQSNSGRNPASWALYGSNQYTEDPDDMGWVLIDEKVDNSDLGATNYTPYDFYISNSIDNLELKQTSVLMNVGDKVALRAAVYPASMAERAGLQWTSSNEEVAKVDKEGMLTAIGLGTCTITLTSSMAPGLKAQCVVTVTSERLGYRYYLMAVSATQGEGILQMAEFDFLDQNQNEVDGVFVYDANCPYFENEGWTNLCDNSTRTKYCGAFSMTACFYFDAGNIIKPAAYRMYTANDTNSIPGRNPSTWKLYGSNTYSNDPEDKCWVLLDERENDLTMGATSYVPYDFEITYLGDGIHEVASGNQSLPTAVYDLQGRRVSRLGKGVYIMDGKKILK